MSDTIINEVTIYMPSLGGGGAEKSVIRLMHGFTQRGLNITLVLATPHGVLHDEIPTKVRIVNLKSNRSIYSVFKLARYIKKHKPKILLSFLSRGNRNALLAKMLAGGETRIIAIEQNNMSMELKNSDILQKYVSLLSLRYLYPQAARIINVSEAASRDLAKLLPKDTDVITIHNPIVDSKIVNESSPNPPHQWFQSKDIPVILSVGRLTEQKNYVNLIRAFSIVKKYREVRLIILGEGDQRSLIENEIKNYALQDSVYLPGFLRDPLSYMRHASLFVLSSNWEGLPTVLVEALACGCPVVSTDCPSGPAEILENGEIGMLVPVKDEKSLAKAIVDTLNNPPDREILKKRAMVFSVEKSVDKYISVMNLK